MNAIQRALSFVAIILFFFAKWLDAAPAVASGNARLGISGAGASMLPQFSGDSRHLLFVSHANNLVINDDLGPWLDLFIRDLVVSNTVLVSVSTNGVGGADGDSINPCASSNGQFVAFVSRASNLAPGDNNDAHDVFVRDTLSETTRVASMGTDGRVPDDPAPESNVPLSDHPLISANGRWVFFESRATNLTSRASPAGSVNIFARDMQSNGTVLVTANSNGLPVADAQALSSISSDGRFAAFITTNRTLVSGVSNRGGDVYVRDVLNGATAWVSGGLPLGTNNYVCDAAALSANGAYIAFAVTGTNHQLFRRDLATGDTILVSRSCTGTLDLTSAEFGISDDGQVIAFEATNQTSRTVYTWTANACGAIPVGLPCACGSGGGTPPPSTRTPRLSGNGSALAFVDYSDVRSLQHFRLSPSNIATIYLPATLTAANAQVESMPVSISPDGSLVAFQALTPAINFETNQISDFTVDFNNASDIFVRDLSAARTTLISRALPSAPPAAGLSEASLVGNSLSSDAGRIVYTRYDEASFGDTNRWPDVFLAEWNTGAQRCLSIRTTNSPSEIGGTVGTNTVPGNTNAYLSPVISADGSTVAALQIHSWNGSFPGEAYLVMSRTTNGPFPDGMVVASRDKTGQPVSAATPGLSADGLLLTFSSMATTMTDEPYNSFLGGNVFVRYYRPLSNGLFAPTNCLLSRSVNGTTGNALSTNPIINLSGSWVAYWTLANDLVPRPLLPPEASLGAQDVQNQTWVYTAAQLVACNLGTNRQDTNFLHGITPRLCSYNIISNAAPFADAGEGAFWQTALMPLTNGVASAQFSQNLRYVLFSTADGTTYRHDLLGLRTNYYYLSALSNGLYRITNSVEPGAPNVVVCTNCANPSGSADGRVVAYERTRADSGIVDIYCVDLSTGQESLVSGNMGGGPGNGSSTTPLVSADARFVVFQSQASDLVANDGNGAADIFVRDRLLGVTLLVSANSSGRSGNGPSLRPIMALDGRTVAFQSFASDLAPGDYNETRDVFVLKLAGTDTDHDGMDDEWEMAYFGDLSRDGTGDFDNDGVSDRDEFLAGTDPTNANSVVRPLTVSSVGGGSTRLVWSGSPARAYRIEFKDDLAARSWQALDLSPAWNGSTATVTDLNPRTNRFYRLVRLP